MNFKIKNLIFVIILLTGIIFLSGCGAKKESGESGKVLKDKEEQSLTEILEKAKGITSFKYDMVATVPGQAAVTTKMWWRGQKTRMEGTFDGRDMVYLVDAGKQIAYMYMPAENMAMKISLGKAKETAGESPIEQSGSVEKYNPVTLGSEVLDGKSCLVVEYTAEGTEVKMWIWEKYGLPIKTESTTAQGTSIVELKNIDFGNISDRMFELPAGVQMMQIPSF